MAVMSNQVIPRDTVLGILRLLPVKSLVRFQSVSKECLSLINDPYFIKLHLKQSVETRNDLKTTFTVEDSDKLESLGFVSVFLDIPKELSPGAEIVGSCNGILCLLNRYRPHGSILMWNISTGESKVFLNEPMEPYVRDEVYREIFYGFGYDSFNDDYKLVRIVQDKSVSIAEDELNIDFSRSPPRRFSTEVKVSRSPPRSFSTEVKVSRSPPWLFSTEVKVYSLKKNSWRSCEQIPNYYFSRNYWGVTNYTFVCGALHWLGTKEKLTCLRPRTRVIIAFDVSTEKHHPIKLPNGMRRKDNIALGALRGCLCAITRTYKVVNVWVMKDYGVKESWTIMHCLQYQSLSVPYLKLLWYDVKGEEFKDEDFPKHWENSDFDKFCPKAVICTESLVKLADQRE